MTDLNTRDIGLNIGLKLESGRRTLTRYDDECEEFGNVRVDFVDMSDPDNLILELMNGQRFRIRIFAD